MKGRSSLEYSPLSNRVKPTIVENPFLGGIGGVRGGGVAVMRSNRSSSSKIGKPLESSKGKKV